LPKTAFTRNVFAGFFSEDDIDDLISEVVLRIWAKRERYDENRGTVNAWVNGIARNIVLDAAELAAAENVGAPVIHTAVCRLRSVE